MWTRPLPNDTGKAEEKKTEEDCLESFVNNQIDDVTVEK